MSKRFRIAFSFAGEKRDFVAYVAAILAKRFGEDKILCDKYHQAEFAGNDLGYCPRHSCFSGTAHCRPVSHVTKRSGNFVDTKLPPYYYSAIFRVSE